VDCAPPALSKARKAWAGHAAVPAAPVAEAAAELAAEGAAEEAAEAAAEEVAEAAVEAVAKGAAAMLMGASATPAANHASAAPHTPDAMRRAGRAHAARATPTDDDCTPFVRT
jgi:hypothetical protein